MADFIQLVNDNKKKWSGTKHPFKTELKNLYFTVGTDQNGVITQELEIKELKNEKTRKNQTQTRAVQSEARETHF